MLSILFLIFIFQIGSTTDMRRGLCWKFAFGICYSLVWPFIHQSWISFHSYEFAIHIKELVQPVPESLYSPNYWEPWKTSCWAECEKVDATLSFDGCNGSPGHIY